MLRTPAAVPGAKPKRRKGEAGTPVSRKYENALYSNLCSAQLE
jgi:hypothetical protein